MKKTIKNISILSLLFLSFASCEDNGYGDYSAGATKTEAAHGQWYIIALEPDGETPAYGGDYEMFYTYSTNENDENFWIDDHESWMEIKTKAKILTNKNGTVTFAGDEDAPELYSDGTVTVTKGQILKKAAKSFSGAVTDSIYFEAEFDWDPGTVYKFAGHRRTGFVEDDL